MSRTRSRGTIVFVASVLAGIGGMKLTATVFDSALSVAYWAYLQFMFAALR